MTGEGALTPDDETALIDMAVGNVAADPSLFDDGRSLAFAAVDQYRRAHAALELALADFAALDPVLASEAMDRFRCYLGLGDLLMQQAGHLVVFGRSEGGAV